MHDGEHQPECVSISLTLAAHVFADLESGTFTPALTMAVAAAAVVAVPAPSIPTRPMVAAASILTSAPTSAWQ